MEYKGGQTVCSSPGERGWLTRPGGKEQGRVKVALSCRIDRTWWEIGCEEVEHRELPSW